MDVSAIKQMELMAAARGDVVSLAQGIPSFDTPEVVKAAAVRAIGDGRAAAYSLTYGLAELRQAIAADLARDGMDYDWEREIVVTCGAAEAIAASLRALIGSERREVIVPAPSYASYPGMVRAAGGMVRYVELEETDRGWRLDVEDLRAMMGPQTAAVLLANPNNPTGHCYSREELVAVAEAAAEVGAYVICDEVYRDFVFGEDGTWGVGEGVQECGRWWSPAMEKGFGQTVIRVFSFSKAFAMTGWRVGYVHGAAEVMGRIVGVHDGLVTCAPVVSQYAAVAALTEGRPAVAAFCRALQERRDRLCRWLDSRADLFRYRRPEAAYFVLARLVGEADDWAFARRLLDEAGVAVVPGSAFGPGGEGRVRLCFGRSEADLAEAMERIDKWRARV